MIIPERVSAYAGLFHETVIEPVLEPPPAETDNEVGVRVGTHKELLITYPVVGDEQIYVAVGLQVDPLNV